MDSAVLLDLLGNENRRRILRLLSHKPCYVTEISEYLGVSPKAVIDHLRKLEEAGLIESRSDDRRRKYFHISRGVRLEVSVSPYGFATKSAYPANPSLGVCGRCSHLSLDLRSLEVDAPAEEDGEDDDGGGIGPEPAPPVGAGGSEAEDRSADEGAPGAADGGTAGAVDPAGSADEGVDAAEPTAVPPAEDAAALAAEFAELETLQHELSLAQRWVDGRITEVLDRLSERMAVEADSRFLAEVLAAVVETDGAFDAVVDAVGADASTVDDALAHLADRGLVAERDGRWRVTSPSN